MNAPNLHTSEIEEQLELLIEQVKRNGIVSATFLDVKTIVAAVAQYDSAETEDARAIQAKLQHLLLSQRKPLLEEVTAVQQTLNSAEITLDTLNTTVATLERADQLLTILSRIDTRLQRDEREQLEQLRQAFTLHKRQHDQWRRFAEIKAESDALLASAADTTLPGQIALSRAEEALTKVRGAFTTQAEGSIALRSELAKLQAETERTRNRLRRLHEMPTTRVLVGDLASLIRDWQPLAAREPETRVTYWSDSTLSADQEEQPIAHAIEIARERYRAEATNKLNEYATNATAALERSAPNEAWAAVQQWRKLPGLFDDAVLNDGARRSLENLIRPKEQEVKAAYDRWLRTRDWIEQANETVPQNPLAALMLYEKAFGDGGYAAHPDLPALRAEIEQQARKQVTQIVSELENAVRREQWSMVNRLLQRADQLRSLLTPSEPLLTQLNEFVILYNDGIAPWLNTPRAIDAERDYLLGLQRQYASSYWNDWHNIQQRVVELDARRSVQGMVAEIERNCNPQTTLSELMRLQRDVQAFKSSPSNNGQVDMQPLDAALRRLEAWIGYATARDEFALETEIDESADIALDLIQLPDLQRIAEALIAAERDVEAQRAVQQANYARRLQRLQTNDRRARQTLDRIGRLLNSVQSLEIDELRDMRLDLQRQLRKPTTLHTQLMTTYEEVRDKLHQRVSRRLRELVSQDSQFYQDLPIAEAKMLVEELERV